MRLEVEAPADGVALDVPTYAVRTRGENLRGPLRFELDGQPLAEPDLPVGTLTEGAHRLIVRTEGAPDVERRFFVDRTPPTLEVRAPGRRVPVSGRWPVEVRVTDATGVAGATARFGERAQALAPVDGAPDQRRGTLVAPPVPDGATLPVAAKIVAEAVDGLGHRAEQAIDVAAGLVQWALTIGVEPGAYALVPASDGGFVVLTGGSVVRVGADGTERMSWQRADGIAAGAVPTPDGGVVVRFVVATDPPTAVVIRLDAAGAETARSSEADGWPLAMASVAGGVAVAWRTPAGARLTRIEPTGAAAAPESGVSLRGEPRTLHALPDGGVLVRYADALEVREAGGATRWTRPVSAAARAYVAPGGVAVAQGDQVELVDAAGGASRGTFTARSPRVVVRPDGFLVTSKGTATLLAPDAKVVWTSKLPAGARISADGRVAWRPRDVMVLTGGGSARGVDAPVFAAAGAGDGALVIVGGDGKTPPEARILGRDGSIRLREVLSGYRWLDDSAPVGHGLILHARTPPLPAPGRPRPPIARLLRLVY